VTFGHTGKGRKKNPGINPGQPVGNGQEKKTLVLILGRLPEKGWIKKRKKKNPVINPGHAVTFGHAGKGQRKKKNPGMGSPPEKGGHGPVLPQKMQRPVLPTD
jgi:hypothetical protein